MTRRLADRRGADRAAHPAGARRDCHVEGRVMHIGRLRPRGVGVRDVESSPRCGVRAREARGHPSQAVPVAVRVRDGCRRCSKKLLVATARRCAPSPYPTSRQEGSRWHHGRVTRHRTKRPSWTPHSAIYKTCNGHFARHVRVLGNFWPLAQGGLPVRSDPFSRAFRTHATCSSDPQGESFGSLRNRAKATTEAQSGGCEGLRHPARSLHEAWRNRASTTTATDGAPASASTGGRQPMR